MDPGRPGPNTVHFTFFTKGGSEQPIDGANATMTTPLGRSRASTCSCSPPATSPPTSTSRPDAATFTINATPAQGPPITASFTQQIK